MAGAGSPDGRRVVAGRVGLRGFLSLCAESAGLVRASRPLQASIARWAALGLVLGEGLAAGLGAVRSPLAAVASALGTLGWWAFVTFPLVAGAAMLVTPDGRRLQYLGVPNGLTAVRAYLCLPLLLGALLATEHRIGFIVWGTVGAAAGMLDALDGRIARRIGPITELGRALDPAMDAVFFGFAAVGGLVLGILPVWLMALLLLRYLAPLLATPFVFLTRRRPQLGHTVWGRRNTVLTGAVMAALLVVRSFDGPVGPVALALGIPLLVTTTMLHFVALARRVLAAPVVVSRRDGSA